MDALFEIGVERPASLSMSIAQVRETLPAGGGGWVGGVGGWGGGGLCSCCEGLVNGETVSGGWTVGRCRVQRADGC